MVQRIIDVSRIALDHNLTGLEFACGIPGSVGGALYMNAGAYGGEISFVLTEAVVMTGDGELRTLTKEAFEFDIVRVYLRTTITLFLKRDLNLKKVYMKKLKQNG